MSGKRYSAGAIFLQVVPVFAGVQEAVADQAKDWDRALGDQMEKSGEKAGKRAGKAASDSMNKELEKGAKESSTLFAKEFEKNVEGINRALADIDVKRLPNEARREISALKKEIKSLSETDLFDDRQLAAAEAKIHGIVGDVQRLRDGAKIVLKDNFDETERGLRKIQAQVERFKDPVEFEVRADLKPLERQMGSFERSIKKTMDKAARHLDGSLNKEVRRLRDELDYLSKLRVGIDIGSEQLKREVREINSELDQLARKSPEIDVKFESGRAWAELAAFDAAVDRVDGKDVKIDAKVGGVAKATGLLAALGLAGDNGANSFRSFNLILLATSSIGPALIPVLAALAGGLAALGPAAAVGAAGIGAVLIGFSGLSDALTALSNQQEQAAMTAQTSGKAQASAARAIRDAEEALSDARRNAARAEERAAERVADARESAADAIENALERQRDAQEAYRDSVKDVQDAEQALREARAQAQGTGQALDLQIRQNALDLDQALLDSFHATVEFNTVTSDGSATNAEKEQARIDRESALLALEELRAEQRKLAAEKKKWDEEGVNGVKSVERAQDNLTSAIEAQQDALEAIREAARDADKARVEGAKAVQDALEDQRETAEDSARAIQDAQERIADANEAYADSLTAINSQQNAVQQAMEKLGPAGEAFALFLFGLREGFRRLRDDIQSVMLPAVQDAIEGFLGSENASIARDALIGLAAAFGDFAQALSVSLQGDAWRSFFEMLRDVGPIISQAYGRAFIAFMEAMASLMVVTAPLAVRFGEGFARMMESFANWSASAKGQESIVRFFDYVVSIGGKVLDFIGAFARAFGALAVALAPLGEIILNALTDIFNFIADMDSSLLRLIATSVILGIFVSQLIFGLASLALGLGALATTFGAWVIGIVLVVGGLIYLWKTNEEFRDFVIDAWNRISGAIAEAWSNHIKPALLELWDALKLLWKEILQPFFAWLGPVLVWLMEKIIPAFGIVFAGVIRAIAWAIENGFVKGILMIADILTWLWDKVFGPVFRLIGGIVLGTFRGIKWAWDNILWPVLSTIGNFIWEWWKGIFKVVLVLILAGWKACFTGIKLLWQHVLKPLFGWIADGARWLWREGIRPALDGIERGWDSLMRGMKWVWNAILKPIFDALIGDHLPALEGAFQSTVNAIKRIWNGLKAVIATPIAFVLETILNDGLIAGFNKVAKWVNMDGFDRIEVPQSILGPAIGYATGGVLPGYTPGRDVHRFVSPTGGRLDLSGGEAIMRPEFTAAVGPGYVNQINALARQGGVQAVRDAIYGANQFFLGGIMPLPGATSVSQHMSGYSSAWSGDLNKPDDEWAPIVAWMDGIVANMKFIGDQSYGRWIDINHAGGQFSRYAHMNDFGPGMRLGAPVSQGQVVGYVGSVGNSSGPHLHFEVNGGAVTGGSNAASGGGGGDTGGVPGWMKSIIMDPLGAVKNWITAPLKKASEAVTSSPPWGMLKKAPALLAEKTTDKIWDVIPGWAKTAVGWAGDAAEWTVGGVKNAAGAVKDATGAVVSGIGSGAGAVGDFLGFAHGGILPYNGTMKYDSGGYLPPGLTSVVNLTGKPEPVFTADQYEELELASGTIHYEPHFEGSDLTAGDVAADMNFAFKRIRRGGKYAEVGS